MTQLPLFPSDEVTFSIDVTGCIEFTIDGPDQLDINQCVCGHEFAPRTFTLECGVAETTPCCGRKLRYVVTILEDPS